MFVSEPKTPEQLEALALTTYIEDLSRRLENREYDIEGETITRTPSPPPEYDRYGKRTNTREQRIVRELEIERTLAVYRALELIPCYAPPVSFTKLTRSTEKYFLPVRKYPHINFIGLLLGPRGNNLRRMETESGAKISIRGRGSVKEGSRSSMQPGFDEDLHCAVTAISQNSIKRAFDLIQQVVDTATDTPEHQNDFKRLQLRQLAELNGTLRDYENQLCSYCHQPGHRKYACPQRQAMIATSECRNCREVGHLMKDCPHEKQIEIASDADDSNAAVEDFLNEVGNTEEYDAEDKNTDEHNVSEGNSDNKKESDEIQKPIAMKLSHTNSTEPTESTETQESVNSTGNNSTSPTTDSIETRSQPIRPPGLEKDLETGSLPAPPGIAKSPQDLHAPPGLSAPGGARAPPGPPPAFKIPPPPAAWKPPSK